ncbi:MAG: hypothetical protein IRZ07_13135, partial [Microbispora sp.]|nr:hypothetical protein [Microbispora sp.]
MRGKDSGSEHENEWARREADAEGSATPPTPPPSFGQTPPPGFGQPPADGGTAWTPDAAGAAGQPLTAPYPVRFGLPGGLQASEPPADDPESTNRFRAIPAYGPPPGDAGLPAPHHPGDEQPALPAPADQGERALPAYGPPAWQPPAPAAPPAQPPAPAGSSWQPDGQGMP